MFDLLERSESEWASVPVPLPGRVMLFAGLGGVPMVRGADGAVRGFSGAPGAGFKLVKKMPGAVLTGAIDVQMLLSCAFESGELVSGDVVEVTAVLLRSEALIAKMNVYVRMDGGAWYRIFFGLRVMDLIDMRVSVVVAESGMCVIARCCAAVVGTGVGSVVPLVYECKGVDAVAFVDPPFTSAPVLEVAIEWQSELIGTVRALPCTLWVS